jgi:hypothetical protein
MLAVKQKGYLHLPPGSNRPATRTGESLINVDTLYCFLFESFLKERRGVAGRSVERLD